MSDLAEIAKFRQRLDSRSLIRISYHRIGLYVAAIEGLLIFCASTAADLAYNYFWHGITPVPEVGTGIGMVACAIFWLSARPAGLYSLQIGRASCRERV